MFELQPDKAKGMCKVKYCRHRTRQNRTLCGMHSMRKFRTTKPLKARYAHMKWKAKVRGIIFTISYEYFETFCTVEAAKGTDLLAHELTIDRIDAVKGYEEGNLQILSSYDNIAKGNAERHRADYVAAKIARNERKHKPVPVAEEEEYCNEPF